MSEEKTSEVKASAATLMQPTTMLRWKLTEYWGHEDKTIFEGKTFLTGDDQQRLEEYFVLQQKWIDTISGKEEWVNVETEY